MEGQGGGQLGMGELIVGRWICGAGTALVAAATVHRAAPLDGLAARPRLLELHPLGPGVDGPQVEATVRAIAGVFDPNLVTVVDVGLLDGTASGTGRHLYLVTDTWEEVLAAGPRSEDDVRTIGAAAADGLAALHGAGLVHGAVSRRALRRTGSRWRLAGAGLGPLLGTEIAPYRAPGLGVVEPVGPAADAWSLGMVLHELATGRILRPGERPQLSASLELGEIIDQLVDASPGNRLAAGEAARQLRGGPAPSPRSGPSVPAGPPGAPGDSGAPPTAVTILTPQVPVGRAAAEPTGRPPARRWRLLVAAGVAGLMVAAGLGYAGLQSLGDGGGTATGSSAIAGADAESASASSDGSTSAGVPPAAPSTSETISGPVAGAPGPVALTDLAVGDCGRFGLGLVIIDQGERLPCDEDHEAEVIAIDTRAEAELGDAYPGRQVLLDRGQDLCDQAYDQYVGGQIVVSQLAADVIVPTFAEWQGLIRRSIICVVHRYDGGDLDGSVAGAEPRFRITNGDPAPLGRLAGILCFDPANGVAAAGKRQLVVARACQALHRSELYTFGDLPPELVDPPPAAVDAGVLQGWLESVQGTCEQAWDELLKPAAVPAPAIQAVVPEDYDWQLGDRGYLCVASWDEPRVGSVAQFDFQATGSPTNAGTSTTGAG